jgi:hypothetical protein
MRAYGVRGHGVRGHDMRGHGVRGHEMRGHDCVALNKKYIFCSSRNVLFA